MMGAISRPARRRRLADGVDGAVDLLVIGVDIGGTKVAAGVVDTAGHIVAARRRPTPAADAQATEDAICAVVEELAAEHPVVAVGIGAAGFVDSGRTTIVYAPHLAWRDEPLRDAIGRRVGLPVVVENDANAAGWAEYRFGAGRGESTLVCITLGTGIGGSLVVDGAVMRGRYGMAGEFGHMTLVPSGRRCACGKRGCWEEYAGGTALVRRAKEAAMLDPEAAHGLLARVGGDADEITGPVLAAAARDRDKLAVAVLADTGHWLGLGLANLAAALDPGAFLIGGGASAAGEALLEPARAAYRENLTGAGHRPQARVQAAALGADAGLIGAADLARPSAD